LTVITSALKAGCLNTRTLYC